MFIIGHRGAAGLELENTESSIRRALSLGVDAVEFDIRKTKDNQLVLAHDASLSRTAGDSRKISSLKFSDLKNITMFDGSHILRLEEALEIVGDKAYIIIDVKDSGCTLLLTKVLKNFPKHSFSLASFKLREVAALKELNPNLHLIGLEHTKPFEIVQFARRLKLDGIGLNFWLLNPLTYWLARRNRLDVYVYTLNKKYLARVVGWIYPRVAVCTDHPEWFLKKGRKVTRWPNAW